MTLIMFSLVTAADAISLGMKRAEVFAELGAPTGTMTGDDFEVLMYRNGKVQLREGQVISIELVSDAELAAQAKQRAEQQAERLARGLEAKEAMIESREFQNLSAEQQVLAWRRFQRMYPMIDVEEPYRKALVAYEIILEQKAEERRTDRITELERRVAQAEALAQQAEERARRAERDARGSGGSYFYYGYESPRSHYISRGPSCYYSQPRIYSSQRSGLNFHYKGNGIKVFYGKQPKNFYRNSSFNKQSTAPKLNPAQKFIQQNIHSSSWNGG